MKPLFVILAGLALHFPLHGGDSQETFGVLDNPTQDPGSSEFTLSHTITTVFPSGTIPPLPAGAVFKLDLTWHAVPTGADHIVFVHFVKDGESAQRFQVDHTPPIPTSQWSGFTRYRRSVEIPGDTPEGMYRIYLGLFTATPGDPPVFKNAPLQFGPGVTAAAGNRYEIGQLVVDNSAPPPKPDSEETPSLDLSGYKLVFQDEFDTMDIKDAYDKDAHWFGDNEGDFGEADFVFPGSPSPYSVANGILSITARKTGGRWTSGYVKSVNRYGLGFSRTYGYFEMRAKLPGGIGTWPAFWLVSTSALTSPDLPFCEIDILEQWGAHPNRLYSTVHEWSNGASRNYSNFANVPVMSDGFHTYGALVGPEEIVFYFDGIELWRQSTPEIAKTPKFILIDMGIGGDNNASTAQTPNPAVLLIDYVRVYAQ